MKKILTSLFFYLIGTSYLIAEINLVCATTVYSSRIGGKIETSEVMPSTFTVVIDKLGKNKVIARVTGSAETGGKCSPYKGTATDVEYVLKCSSAHGEDFMKINRISGKFTNNEHTPGDSEWFIQISGSCRKGSQRF